MHITALEPDVVRVQHLPDGDARLNRTWVVVGKDGDTPVEGRLRDDLTPFSTPDCQTSSSDSYWRAETRQLSITLDLADGHLEWHTADGIPIAADLKRRAYTYDRAGRSVYHYLQRRSDEHYFGFGERSGPLDKQGLRLEMRNIDALGYNAETSDPLYKHIPFYITFIPHLNIAYGLFYDNFATTVFDLGKEIDALWGSYRLMKADDGDVDYYFIYGPTIEAVIEKYTRLTGRPALLPRWAFGYLGSTMSYTDAANAQEQLHQFVTLCQQHDIPCDLFHLSSGYSMDAEGRRNVFTWNRSRVPSPEDMVNDFHAAGIRLAANIKPYLLTTHPQYEQVRMAGGFIRDPDTGEPASTRFWSGGRYESADGAYIDFTSAAGFNWWQQQIRTALYSFGIDAPWNDNNEFGLWDDDAVCAGFGNPLPVGLARPLQTLLMARASYDVTREAKPGLRPFILSRAGTAGIQRYVQTWSGDNETSWHTLRYNIPMGLGLSLSGVPNIGHDVGGFSGPAPDPELFVRWVQCGIFHPRFTIHSWNTDGTVNEPWMHPSVLPIIRDLFRFRYRLLPYLYTLAFEAHQTGHPIIRPLVYHFPQDKRCQTESFDFMLGSHLLVAPVLEPGARTRRVYLPAGTWWCDFHSGQWYMGGSEIEVPAPLEQIPLFVADGGILPLGGVMRYVGERPDDVREIHAFVRGDATFTLIEDDGVSFDYQQGGYTEVQLSLQRMGDHWTVNARRLHNGYTLPYREVDFVVAAGDGAPVTGGTLEGGRWRARVTVL
ncbi:MAG: glycoside hydrolase family 31 protein [Anaerolineae bacterium]|nr:glycoside hydrolase family 31 protein [Anaerolineae bacterium]